MNVEAVDFFYLAMPQVTTEADGSQDALLVRVAAGGLVGYGECEAAPLPSIAAFVCPMSHGGCRPVSASVLGRALNSPLDIAHIGAPSGGHMTISVGVAATFPDDGSSPADLIAAAERALEE